jgi:phage shock protein E
MAIISVSKLKKLIIDDQKLVILDIRTKWETKDGCIPKAEFMDVSSQSFMKDILSLAKEKTYCLYCASGGRASMVVPFMEENGFENVYELEGGIISWILQGNPLEKSRKFID